MSDKNSAALRALILITTPKLADRALALFEQGELPVQYRFHGYGTASSETVDLLGLGNIDKSVIAALVCQRSADAMLCRLYRELGLSTTNTGIAFTLPLTGCSRLLYELMCGHDDAANHTTEEGETMSEYSMIAAIINQGFSEEVMTAARTAGAGGGTVFHIRRITGDEVKQSWTLSQHDEREAVLIIAEAKGKLDIMRAISEKCGMNSEAQGVVLSLPIDSVIGLGSTRYISSEHERAD